MLVETTSTIYARKIPLFDTRKKLLLKHEQMGIIRNTTSEAGSTSQNSDPASTGNTKVWHDHSAIAGHGYFLVLVSILYDT